MQTPFFKRGNPITKKGHWFCKLHIHVAPTIVSLTGAIALLLSQRHNSGQPQLNANQVRAALNQSSRGFNGHWNSARGWGMLDTEALLALFS